MRWSRQQCRQYRSLITKPQHEDAKFQMVAIGAARYLVTRTRDLRGGLSDGASGHRCAGQSGCATVSIGVASSRELPRAGMAALMLAAFIRHTRFGSNSVV